MSVKEYRKVLEQLHIYCFIEKAGICIVIGCLNGKLAGLN